MLTIYSHPKCTTCLKAKKVLLNMGLDFKDIDITKYPPKKTVLKDILKNNDYPFKKLFNTSGHMYRMMNLKEKIPSMPLEEALDLLSKDGMLVKRPVVTNGKDYVVGFNEQKIRNLADL